MGPIALRGTAAFFIGLPILSLATGAWKDNHIPFAVVLAQAALYISWGAALWRLASVRAAGARRESEESDPPLRP